jgi:A/G-specific adenine glycosylase
MPARERGARPPGARARRAEGHFARQVIDWQRSEGRQQLPWQGTRDPYRVWLSDIMLQQTQVATVTAYYSHFLQRFPDVATLAAAPLDDVLALWSGLGYYSRARNLHRCAQAVMARHGGHFPPDSTQLATLPGIGRSTAAAIAAFCFGERVAILDGNVKRVLTRVLGFDGDLAQAAHERALWAKASALLPQHGIERYTQGLMDLGATLCLPRAPQCQRCPLRAGCVAACEGTPTRYPVKTRKLKRSRREHLWLWLQWRERVWLVQRPPHGVWAGLWSLPEFDDEAAFRTATDEWPGGVESLPSFTHVLTHLDWTLHPRRWSLPARTASARVAALMATWPQGRWFMRDEALAAGLPAPLRKLLVASAAT